MFASEARSLMLRRAGALEGLCANFQGECSEAGMCLAMNRQADRKGYPEVPEIYKRIAFQEAPGRPLGATWIVRR